MRSLTVPRPGPNVPCLGREIPVAEVSVDPVLSLEAFRSRSKETVLSVLDVGPALAVTSARAAIALALQHAGIGAGDKVLIPAYHCSSMVTPLSYVGAEPGFYRMREGLAPDLDDIAAKFDARTRAVLVTHYFGFPQDLEELRRFCDEKGMILIEDCAHCFFGEWEGAPIGSVGDFAVASAWKFFPLSSGGFLVSRQHDLSAIALRQQGWLANAKTGLNLVEDATYYGRLPMFKPLISALATMKGLRQLRFSQRSGGQVESPPPDPVAATYGISDSEPTDVEMTTLERAICNKVSFSRSVRRRRQNYERLLAAVSDLPGCQPLFPSLDEGVTPYVFPLRVEKLEARFASLEDAALPMQRFGQFLWPKVDESVCAISADYSHHVVQFCCHQEIEDSEMGWMIEQIVGLLAQ